MFDGTSKSKANIYNVRGSITVKDAASTKFFFSGLVKSQQTHAPIIRTKASPFSGRVGLQQEALDL